MKINRFVLILFLIAISCNEHTNDPKSFGNDTLEEINDHSPDTISKQKRDSTLLNLSIAVLKAVQRKDYKEIASFVSPGAGVRFSPYGYIDISTSQVLSASEIIEYSNTKKQLVWGVSDGSGDTIKLSLAGFIDKFLYNKEYASAPKKSVNQFLGHGNSLNNLKDIFPGSDFTEFYFPGFDRKYEGMDWQTIRLVFNIENGNYVLIGIIHDEWTI